MNRASVSAAAFFFLFASTLLPRLVAQDATVTPLEWFDPRPAPDDLPERKPALRVRFPDELEKTAEIGWALMAVTVDQTGRIVSQQVCATQPAYALAVEKGNRDWHKFTPAHRSGQAVESRVCLAVIFNPASASIERPDATPRLLHATAVMDPRLPPTRRGSAVPPEVLWVLVAVDPQGNGAIVSGPPAELAPLLEAGLRQWRFAPARHAGVPVAAQVRVPVILLGPEEAPREASVSPRPISKQPPVYPPAMFWSGLRGDVLVEFVVDQEGRVQNAVVVRSLNPGFNDAALEAIKHWRFEPGRIDGRPVNTRMQQPISFSLEGVRDGGDDGIVVQKRADQSKLPPQLQYDTPPKTVALVLPIYPYALLREKQKGKARITLLINAEGKVAMSKVVEADRPEFGYALQAAAEQFEYLPALKDGQPTNTVLTFEQEFRMYDERLVGDPERTALALERKHPERILKAADLDERLKPTITRMPMFPRGERQLDAGTAVVEFLVDQEGRVVLPRVVSTSDPQFGYAAVQAVSAWHFKPPTSKGKPGVVRVSVPIDFKRPVDDHTPAVKS